MKSFLHLVVFPHYSLLFRLKELWGPQEDEELNAAADTWKNSFNKYVMASWEKCSFFHICSSVVEFFPRLIFWITIPNCDRLAGKEWRWPLTLVMSLLWISVICYVMIEWVIENKNNMLVLEFIIKYFLIDQQMRLSLGRLCYNTWLNSSRCWICTA